MKYFMYKTYYKSSYFLNLTESTENQGNAPKINISWVVCYKYD